MNSTLKILLFLGLLYLSLQAGFQCNIMDCQYCSYPNVCGQCQNNYLLTFNTTSGSFYCDAVSCPSNCMTCYQNNSCQICNNNYFLSSNGTCSTSQTSNSSLPPDCLWGYNSENCTLCSYGFSLQAGFCYSNITLTTADVNCIVKQTSTICQICQNGFIVNFLGQCVPNSINSSCNTPNCAYCQNSNSTCTTCMPGYQLTSSGTCATDACNITGCTVCSTNNTSQCQACGTGYMLNSSTNSCYAVGYGCNIKWCQTCSSGQSCGQCQTGYQLSPFQVGNTTVNLCSKIVCPYNIQNCNACTQNYDSIFQYNQILCAPNSCMTGYINVNGYCVPNITNTSYTCSSVSNCQTCSYPNYCSQCQNGYSLTRYGTCQVTLCQVANCAACSLNNICEQCNNGYTLSTGMLAVLLPQVMIDFAGYVGLQQCIPNTGITCNLMGCLYCTSNNVCGACANGYDWDSNNSSTCSPLCNVSNCYQCTQGPNASMQPCSVCSPGYELVNNGSQCVQMNFTCSLGCSNSTTNSSSYGGSCVYNTATNSGQCLQCTSGMILYQGQCYQQTCNIYGCELCSNWATPVLCLRCQQSLLLSNGYCLKFNCNDSVPNCANCIENGKCVGCEEGYLLQNNTNGSVTCIYANNISNCGVSNCLECVSGNVNMCQTCASPYVVNNGICVCKFQNCLDCSMSTLTCNSCPPPLFASLQEPNCVPEPSLNSACNVSNCQNCFTNGKCSLCAMGYSLNTTDYSCTLNNCSNLGLQNCQLCDQYGYQCHVCVTGYMIDNFLQGGQCYQINQNYSCNISGCAVCNNTNNSICASCLPTYMSNGNGGCTALGCNIQNCFLCLSDNFCTVCDSGFYLASDLTCQPLFSFISNCSNSIPYCEMCVANLVNGVNSGDYCIKCQGGFEYNAATSTCIPQTNSIPNCKVQLPNYADGLIPLCLVCEQGYFVNFYGVCSSYSPPINNTGCSVYNCLYCAQNSTTCSFCFEPWGISPNGQCQTNISTICGSLANCAQCANSSYCITCAQSYTAYLGSCIACNVDGCSLCQQTNNCSTCQPLYTPSNGLCLACNITGCITCSNNNVCQTCQSSGGLMPSSNGNACIPCNVQNCSSCTTNNTCGVCKNGFQLYQGNCLICNATIVGTNCIQCSSNNVCNLCAKGYTLTTNGTCVLCQMPCATCNPNATCATCATPLYFSTPATNGSCIANTIPNCLTYNASNTTICTSCGSKYQLNSTSNTCNLICNSNCATCSATNSSQCLTCPPAFYLSSNNTCMQCQVAGCQVCNATNSTQCLTCSTGLYGVNGECQSCPGYCQNCQTSTVCNALVQSSQQVLITQNGMTSVALCAQGCITCSNINPQICLQCANGLYLSNNGICQRCSSSCLTCNSSNPQQCLSCYPNSFLSNSACISCNSNCQSCAGPNDLSLCNSCFPGSYLSNQQCVQGCPLNCYTCTGQSVCTQCNSGYTLFTQNNNQTLCVPCISSCRACVMGSPSTCLSCGTGFYLSGSSCIACSTNCQNCNAGGCTSCVSGFFLTSSQTCSPNCALPCATCSSNNPARCTSCIAGYNYTGFFSCTPLTTCNGGACSVCPMGYTLNAGQCLSCNVSNCQTCNPTNTTECTSCAPGFYLNVTTDQCQACPSSCSTCSGNNGCLTCASGFTSLAGVNAGPGGYQCLACTSPCATCLNSPNYCTSCISGFSFNGWKCSQNFHFSFTVVLLTTITTFNQNYLTFISALAQALGSSDPNIITINSIQFGSVSVVGGAAPTAPTGSSQASQQYNSFDATLATNANIGGMQVGSSSITVVGGTVSYDSVNLALILGICIPVGVLLIAGIGLYIYCKKKKSSDIIEQRIKEDSGFTVRESFQLSSNYKEQDTNRPFQENTTIN